MKLKRKKIIRILGILLIVVGIGIISYPFYTNLVMKRQEVAILEAWESQVNPNISADTNAPEYVSSQDFEQKSLIVDPEKKIPFKIKIPGIDSVWIVNAGTDTATLKKGPGHYTDSALPGEIGRCVIAGHRTTYGSPFNRVDELKPGDKIIIETAGNEEFTYLVTHQEQVLPENVSVLEQTENATLALTTCTPKYYATKRLIIYAELAQ